MSFILSKLSKYFSKKPKTILIVDVGSGSVGVALIQATYSKSFKVDQDLNISDKQKVIYSFRKEISFGKDRTFRQFSSVMYRTLDSVVKKAFQENKIRPDQIHCFLSSPWFIAESRKVSLDNDKVFIVSKKKVDQLIEKDIQHFTNKVCKTNKHFKKGETVLIDAKNTKISLNGYETENPFGKNTKFFEADVFVSISTEKIVEGVRSHISNHFSNMPIEFHSFTLASFLCVRDIFSNKKTFLFLDITEELTNVVLVRDGSIYNMRTVAVGRQSLIRKIANKLGTNNVDSFSQFVLFSQDKLKKTAEGKLQKVLGKYGEDWSNKIIEAVNDLTYKRIPPNTIFITSGTHVSEWFGQQFSHKYLNNFSLLPDMFESYPLHSKMLDKFVKYEVDVKRDPFIVLEMIFLSRL